MMGCGPCCFLRILPFIHPPTALQTIPSSSAPHELPHAARAYSRNGQGMKPGLSLGQINQFLGNSFLPEDLLDHLLIAATTDQGMLQRGASAGREIIYVASHGVRQHERQIRASGLNLHLGLCFYLWINREGDAVGFVNGCRFGLLLGESVPFLQRLHVFAVHTFENAVQFLLHALVGVDIQRASERQIESSIKVLLGRVQMPSFVIVPSCLVLLLNLRNNVGDRIWFRLWLLCRDRCWRWGGLLHVGRGWLRDRRSRLEGRCLGLRGRQKRRGPLGCLASYARQKAGGEWRNQEREFCNSHLLYHLRDQLLP